MCSGIVSSVSALYGDKPHAVKPYCGAARRHNKRSALRQPDIAVPAGMIRRVTVRVGDKRVTLPGMRAAVPT